MISDQRSREEAIDPTRSFCVSAPAGSGKTELLTQRLLALLARVDRPEQVLAITFTRKAASEMAHRVMHRLEQAQKEAPVTADHDKVTRRLAQNLLEHAAQRQWQLNESSLNLRTIDSFCHELTRQMPVLSGIGGMVEPVDNAVPLYEDAVRGFLNEANNGSSRLEIRQLLEAFDNRWSKVGELLVAILGRRGDWGGLVGQHHDPEAAEASITATLDDLISHRLAFLRDRLDAHFENLLRVLNEAQEVLGKAALSLTVSTEDLADWKVVAGSFLTSQHNWRRAGGINKNQGFLPQSEAKGEFVQILQAVAEDEALREALEELFHLPDRRADESGWDLVVLISSLLPLLQAHLLLVFQRLGVVDHTHISLAAIQALGPDELPTPLAQRLDYQIEHLLIDEFQDTSASQAELLRCLTRGWQDHNATGAAPRTLFVVGDAMQSIYGFRHADISLFLRARAGWLTGISLNTLTLSQNFRSCPNVVNWVNTIFSELLGDEDNAGAGRVRFVPAESRADGDPSVASGVTSRLFQSSETNREATYIADEIKTILAAHPEATIAILVRAKSHAGGIANALAERGISCGGDAIQSLPESTVIGDLLSLCRWLANPADSIAALALLRGPWCGLDLSAISALLAPEASGPLDLLSIAEAGSAGLSEGDRQRVSHLLAALSWGEEKRDRLALPIWIEQIWLQLGGPQCACHEDLYFVESFLALLRRAEERGRGLDINWLQQELAGAPFVSDDLSENVRITTLHKAKGLEFDYVFIPYLNRRTRSQNRDLIRWHWHEDSATRGLLIAANDEDKTSNSLYNYLSWLQKIKNKEELKRLLYVGVTRAKVRAILTASASWENHQEPPEPTTGTFFELLQKTTHGPETLEVVPMGANENAGATDRDMPDRRLVRLHRRFMKVSEQTRPEATVSAPTLSESVNLSQESNRLERVIGVITHRVLELLAGNAPAGQAAESLANQWIANNLVRHALGPAQAEAVKARCEALIHLTLTCSTGKWILAAHAEAYSEMVLNRIEDGECKTYIVDRTFHDETAGVRWVLDFKTSQPREGESTESFIAREAEAYRDQLTTYAELIGGLNWTHDLPIKKGLYYPAIQYLAVCD